MKISYKIWKENIFIKEIKHMIFRVIEKNHMNYLVSHNHIIKIDIQFKMKIIKEFIKINISTKNKFPFKVIETMKIQDNKNQDNIKKIISIKMNLEKMI